MNRTPFHLDGKTVLVTGASSGIGAQVAISISQMGGSVMITGRNQKGLQQTFAKLEGIGHQQLICELTDDEQIRNLTLSLPVLQGVVHCAGIVTAFPVKYINRQKIEETFSINYSSAVLLMSALFTNRKIEKRASLVFMSSFSGTYPFSGGALYAGSKAALEKYSEVLAAEQAGSGIRSNCISPALVKTAILEETFQGDRAKYRSVIEERHLLGFGETIDVANTAIFLLSDASKWLTGQNIVLDGGYLLGLVAKTRND